MDNSFLYGDLYDEVYMKPPPGMHIFYPSLVCKLQKSLYGLKQASRQWNQKLSSTLLQLNYVQSTSDYSLFVKKTASSFTTLLVYVDDVVLTGNNLAKINSVKQQLHDQFHIKDLGDLKFFLGFEVARSKASLVFNQRKYCLEILSKFGLTSCKRSNSPANASVRLNSDEGDLLEDATSIRRLIGRLHNLANTRPDIAFVVQHVSQFVSKLRTPHLQVALRILRYLKGSPGLGLFYSIDNDLKIQAFSVSDWATCPVSRKLGYCIFLGKSLISLKAKKQTNLRSCNLKA